MPRFEGRRALITAAGSGLGRGVALRLAREGASVTIWDRDAGALAETAAEARGEGLSLATAMLDMTDGTAIDDAVAAMARGAPRFWSTRSAARCTRRFTSSTRAMRTGTL